MKPVIIQLQQSASGHYVIPYRGELLARMKHLGWDTVQQWCKSQNVNRSVMSQVINGQLWPPPDIQAKLCFSLALNQTELLRLLGVKI